MKLIFCTLFAVVAISFTSCNTFIGIGRDMRLAGEGMEKVAEKASGGTSGGGSSDTSGAPVY